MKLIWTKDCVLPSNGVEDDNADSNNISVTIKDKKLQVVMVTLSAKDN